MNLMPKNYLIEQKVKPRFFQKNQLPERAMLNELDAKKVMLNELYIKGLCIKNIMSKS